MNRYLSVLLGAALLSLGVLVVSQRAVGDAPWVNTFGLIALCVTAAWPVWEVGRSLVRRTPGADTLAAIALITAAVMGEHIAGLLVVTMLTGGQLLESFAVERASQALRALADRMPPVAHRLVGETMTDVPLEAVVAGDRLVVLPHEVVPVDGRVAEGRTRMNEAYLTGEPWEIEKIPGSDVISGAVNGEGRVVVDAARPAAQSRYAQILEVMRESEANRPPMRRMADRLGALYAPLALGVALLSWWISGDPERLLAVLVVATPCPLLIAVPVALVGTVSQAARRGVVIRNPGLLEQIDRCRTLIVDKTGTLTAGRPTLSEVLPAADMDARQVLAYTASLEQFSRHPLAMAVVERAARDGVDLLAVSDMLEEPGRGLVGHVAGRRVELTSRRKLTERDPGVAAQVAPHAPGLEAVVLVDGRYAATLRFVDAPRPEGAAFIGHLGPLHAFGRVLIVSGDRDAEVRAVADALGIGEAYGQRDPAEKVRIVREATAQGPTLYVGDGINDAPALAVATVGVAFGRSGEVAAQAAQAVILEPSLKTLDELIHLGARFRRIALQSALGGMALSAVAIGFASVGLLGPVAGAMVQEAIDLLSVLNALRTSRAASRTSDVDER